MAFSSSAWHSLFPFGNTMTWAYGLCLDRAAYLCTFTNIKAKTRLLSTHYVPDTVLRALLVLTHLIFTIVLCGNYWIYPHFTMGKLRPREIKYVLKVRI